jgi:hypothetical protein
MNYWQRTVPVISVFNDEIDETWFKLTHRYRHVVTVTCSVTPHYHPLHSLINMVVRSKKPKKSRIISSTDISTCEFLFTQSFQNRIRRIPVTTQAPTAHPSSNHPGQDSPQVESSDDPTLFDSADERSPGGVKIHQKAKRYLNSVSITSARFILAITTFPG